MAWLQNLAGRAENLLNKIDKNAATVLNEGPKQFSEDEEKGIDYYYDPDQIRATTINLPEMSSPSQETVVVEKLADTITDAFEIPKSVTLIDENKPENSSKSHHSSTTSSNSIHNSFIITQELDNLQSKLAKLELENQDYNKQLLHIQHLYSEMRNENASLQFQVERLNEQLASAQNEKEQYVARAQRILLEKEKLISLKQTSSENDQENDSSIFVNYNEELKKELEFQQAKVSELSQKNSKLITDMQSLQMQHQVIQQGLLQSNQTLEQNLLIEKKHRSAAEEDCAQKLKDLQAKCQELFYTQDLLKNSNVEIVKLKEALHRKQEPSDNDELANRIQSLTQTLMLKQNKLETTTTERNALRLQLEKLEMEHRKKIAEMARDKVKIINVQETNDDRISVPRFMRVSPHDAGVTRRVKHAYSTLDAISVRTGIFLRRYPVARVFVFSYMVILHIWVLTVLLWYVPSN
ncbi:unnamed protein product [Ceutorhynchus assimilis]|uniref:Golgin-84 n=1 Tax=Ceutorhynchus assimilis TaxID=467358 RepID=A0A9N9QLE6_9CUCU|nr:unnamed protein product [Ceutorhynchus assimilis]